MISYNARSMLCLSQEMYPPKVHQFAYVTDEACTEDEILSMEIIIMKVNGAHAQRHNSLIHDTSVCTGLHLSCYHIHNLPQLMELW